MRVGILKSYCHGDESRPKSFLVYRCARASQISAVYLDFLHASSGRHRWSMRLSLKSHMSQSCACFPGEICESKRFCNRHSISLPQVNLFCKTTIREGERYMIYAAQGCSHSMNPIPRHILMIKLPRLVSEWYTRRKLTPPKSMSYPGSQTAESIVDAIP
jgi:hypothetical protein